MRRKVAQVAAPGQITSFMDANIEQALEEGARRSREAAEPPTERPLSPRFWMSIRANYRWLIIALALFLLIDVFVMGALGGVGGHL